MFHLAAAALLLLSGVEQRTLSLWANDPQTGAAAEGLTGADVAVLEDGTVMEGLQVERDPRVLTVALVLDSSEGMSSAWRLHVQSAVVAFVRKLPAEARVAVWTTGDRARRAAEFGTDREKTLQTIEKTMPFGTNNLLDGLAEAAKELRKQPGDRSVLVAISGAGFGYSQFSKEMVRERLSADVMAVFGLLFDEGAGGRSMDGYSLVGRGDHEFVLNQAARRSGGLFQSLPTAQGTADALAKFEVALRSQYLLRYKTQPNPRQRRTEVKTRMPLTVRLGPASVEEPGGR
ncbi:MAG: VWA domain-containing protein [Vicinamibacteria bacterium]|nr:VWA domain-containing protein [Vicinamibacteria bacterium]